MQSVTLEFPECPSCRRPFIPANHWPGANYCRLRFLMPVIEDQPMMTAWEVAEASGLNYPATSKALTKGREWKIFELRSEPRAAGGIRYRYTVSPKWRKLAEYWPEEPND